MDITKYPLIQRSEAQMPPSAEFQFLFRDKGNGGMLTAKNFDCSFDIISVGEVSQEALVLLNSHIETILEDAGCALKKGQMTSDDYQETVTNLNMCVEVNVDPLTGSQQICVTNTPTLFVALSTSDVLCNGGNTGSASVIVTGGTAPYNVDWGGADETALTAGSYMVTVTDANAKSKALTFIINEPAALSVNPVVVDESGGGNNGSITLNVIGGTAPYTYLWDDGAVQTTDPAVNLSAGDYNCVVTDDNGCVLNVGPITVN
jgi:hypothetical protein